MKMKPLLAAPVKTLSSLTQHLPLVVSPKLDGVRAIKKDGVLLSRTLKPIPNLFVQECFKHIPDGLDGELILGDPTDSQCFRKTTSSVMSVQGCPEVSFHVFDIFSLDAPFSERLKALKTSIKSCSRTVLVEHFIKNSVEEILEFEKTVLLAGYEGVMLRVLEGKYKYGRSTLKEGLLLKLKRFEDSEAIVVSFKELMRNNNKVEKNLLGYTERSSKKDGLNQGNCLGTLFVKDIKTGVEFEIGSGFTQLERNQIWESKDVVLGKIVKYKHFPSGTKEKPRFPIFEGFRDPIDL